MFTSQVFKSILKQCVDDHCPQIAASLAYATLLALIPLSVLIYKIYSTTLIDPVWLMKAQEFVFNSLSPSMAEQVRQYLFKSATQADGLNIIGFFMLLISVIVMMRTIDSALNRIWKIHKPRHTARRFVIYIALLIFIPLAISVSLIASAYIASLPLIAGFIGEDFVGGIVSWLPFVVLWATFIMMYKWIPDCDVKLSHAVYGATFAVCLFEISKSVFTLYVSYFPTYQILYGALAAIPLLLVWIYLTWLIVLLGAEITHFMNK